MSTRTPPETMTEVLRRTIAESGIAYKALSRETGVARASIQRFVDGRQSIRLDMADRLADYYGLALAVLSVISRTLMPRGPVTAPQQLEFPWR
jgi:plasmid maintenance system antidote protein VapI